MLEIAHTYIIRQEYIYYMYILYNLLDLYPVISHKDIMQPFVENQTVNEENLPAMVVGYTAITSKKYKPCFHRLLIMLYIRIYTYIYRYILMLYNID